MGDHRTRRVAELIRHQLTTALARDFSDPRLSGLVITGVEVSGDYSIAKISVRSISPADEAARRRILSSLGGALPKLRQKLGKALKLRRVPELRFAFDTGQDAVERIEALLQEIHAEGAQPSEAEPSEAEGEPNDAERTSSGA